MASCCVCCRKPRYKRLVDSLFPQDPQECSPVAANVDKLLYFAKSSPDHLDRVGDYLALRLRRSVQRERKGHTCVALKITEKLLSDCDQQRIQLIADSYLDMLHTMLESVDTELQIMATSSFVVFAEREEGNTPYHRQYDFFIQRFASLSLVANNGDDQKYKETRLAGLKGLRGVIKKIGHQDSVQLNIWDIDHMNKIVPPFLFNMQHHWQQRHQGRSGQEGEARSANGREIEVINDGGREGDGEEDNLANYAEASLKEVVQCAGLTHIDHVLRPILTHYDLNELWTKHRPLAVEVFVMVVETMPKQDRYKALQALVNHLDAVPNQSIEVKQGVLDTLSHSVAAAADGSLGPSVLDVFKTLVKQLTVSIESEQGVVEHNQNIQDSLKFQDSLTKTMGEFAGVLPDYQKPDIMTLINSYMPTVEELSTVEVVSGSDTGAGVAQIGEPGKREHPLSDSNQQLMSSLVRCLKAVADSYNPAILDTTIPSNLFGSLVKLLAVKDPGTQLEVTKLWHQLIDQQQNKRNIPLHTEWQGLESVGLQIGKVSPFLGKMIPTLLAYLYDQAKILSTCRENVIAFYQLLFLLMLELSKPSITDMVSFLSKLQDLAVKEESQLNHQQRVAIHAIVAGILHLVAQISTNPVLQDNIGTVILCRREKAVELLPDGLFRGEDGLDGGEERAVGDTLEVELELLFPLKDEASMRRASESATSLKKTFGPFGRDSSASGPDLASHFSVSLDYGPESPLNVDQISFNSLKEKVELILTSGEEEGRQGSFGSTVSPVNTEISGRPYGVSVTSQTNNNISFEEAVVQASKEESGGLNLTDILIQASSPASSSGIPIPKPSEPGRVQSSSAYDMELPSLH